MKQVEMHNGDITDTPSVCHRCQQPGDLEPYEDGEWYHPGCRP